MGGNEVPRWRDTFDVIASVNVSMVDFRWREGEINKYLSLAQYANGWTSVELHNVKTHC